MGDVTFISRVGQKILLNIFPCVRVVLFLDRKEIAASLLFFSRLTGLKSLKE